MIKLIPSQISFKAQGGKKDAADYYTRTRPCKLLY